MHERDESNAEHIVVIMTMTDTGDYYDAQYNSSNSKHDTHVKQ